MTQEITKESDSVENVHLILNKEVLAELKKQRITISQLFVLVSAYHGYYSLLDFYDERTKNPVVMVLDYQALIAHGLLTEVDTTTLFKISETGKELVEKIHAIAGDVQTESSQEQNLRQFCQQYLELWPKIKLPSQKYARASVLEIEKKMKSWLKVYKPLFKKEYGITLTNEDILAATKYYVDRYARNGYKFMVTSSYFIQKNEKSALADEILVLKQGLDETQELIAKDNITVM